MLRIEKKQNGYKTKITEKKEFVGIIQLINLINNTRYVNSMTNSQNTRDSTHCESRYIWGEYSAREHLSFMIVTTEDKQKKKEEYILRRCCSSFATEENTIRDRKTSTQYFYFHHKKRKPAKEEENHRRETLLWV